MRKDVFPGDSVVEVLCEEYEKATCSTELTIINSRVKFLNSKLEFDNQQWGILLHYQQLTMMRVG